VDSKAEYAALSSTRSQKLKQRQCPFNTVQVKKREVSPEGSVYCYFVLFLLLLYDTVCEVYK